MRMKRLLTSLASRRSGLKVLGGVTAVLTGVERLMSAKRAQRSPLSSRIVAIDSCLSSAAVSAPAPRQNYFTIRQTRSDVGFCYWVLQGFGCYQGFTLFDTWAEAAAEADRRVVERRKALRVTAELIPA